MAKYDASAAFARLQIPGEEEIPRELRSLAVEMYGLAGHAGRSLDGFAAVSRWFVPLTRP